MLSLGELAGTVSPASIRAKLVLHPHQGGASTSPSVSSVGSPGEQTSACSSCPAQEQHLPRLLHGQDLRGPSRWLRSSLGGAIGVTLTLYAKMLLPV